jgi:hypothetical protein
MPRWPGIHLDFLVEFLRTQCPEGIQVCAVSRKVGVSPPTISILLHRDDANLSTVEKVFKAYGYSLVLDFCKVTPAMTYRPIETPAEAGTLAGLVSILHQLKKTVHSVSLAAEVDDSVVKRLFVHGDVKISTLRRILDVYGITMTWMWVEVPPNDLSLSG